MAGNIKGICIEFRGDATPLQKALNTIRRETKALDQELKQIDRALKFNPGNTTLLAQKQTVLKEKIEQTRKSLKELQEAQARLDDDPSVDKTSEEYRKLQREIIETESKLQHFENELKRLDRYKLEQLGKSLQDIGGKMKDIGKSATMYVTVPLAAAGTKAVQTFADVDKTMQLTNKTMGNTAEQAAMLDKAMRDAAANSTYGMDDAATATLNFARAGLTAEQAAAALAPAMNLAAGEGGNLDTVSAGLVATINGFGGSFEDASKYADVFANACNNSALDIDSLSNAMSIAAPIFKSAGYSVNDAALYMGVMANRGIDANVAANALKTGMARLVEPSKQGAEWMDKLGFSITNADGTMKDSVTVQKELHDAFGTLSDSEKIAAASAIFGKNQMSNWLALIDTAPSEVNELNMSLNEMGTAQAMASAMMEGFGGSIEKLKSGLNVAAYNMGKALAPAVQKVINVIQKAVDWFNNLSEKSQGIVAKIGILVAAIGPLLVVGGTMLGVVGKLVENYAKFGKVLPGVSGALSKVTGIFGKFFGFLTANPILLIIAALAALSLAFMKSGMSADDLSKMIQNMVQKAVQFIEGLAQQLPTLLPKIVEAGVQLFTGLVDGLKNILPSLITALLQIITALIQALPQVLPVLIEGATQLFIGLVQGLVAALPALIDGLVSLITSFTAEMPKMMPQLMEAAVSMFMAIVEAIPQIVAALIAALPQIVQAFYDTLPEPIKAIFEGIKDAAIAIWDALKTALEAVVNAIKTVIVGVLTALAVVLGTIWYGIKAAATAVWDQIKGYVLPVVEAIKTGITTVFNAVKSVLTSIWNALKSLAKSTWDAIKNNIINPVNTAADKVKSVFNALKSFLSSAWSSIKSTASNTWNAIKEACLRPVENLRDKIKGIIEKIKSFFHFTVPTPHIPVPRFSISPSGWSIGDLLDGSIPHLSVSWHKAGAIFDKPTIFHGVGEAGAEAVLPLDMLWQRLDNMADSIVNGIIMGLRTTQLQGAGDITIPIYLYPSGPKMGEETVKAYDKYKNILG